MTKLSVNINKIATLRNARGGNIPDLIKVAMDCERFGAQGITVHPRPDERHIRYQDVYDLKKTVTTEFNIEGYPSDKFIKLVMDVTPAQVTLVPDPPDAITSNAGWDTKKNRIFLKEIISQFQGNHIRTSIFIDPIEEMIEYAKETGTDRVELYAKNYKVNHEEAI
jgi:pyridoxine 5-phosphate synthase